MTFRTPCREVPSSSFGSSSFLLKELRKLRPFYQCSHKKVADRPMSEVFFGGDKAKLYIFFPTDGQRL